MDSSMSMESAPHSMPSDEAYIIDLCDDILGLKASRGHRFDFLVGNPDRRGRCHRLPVDAYYKELELVVEYHERQHHEPISFFDRRIVASGITRGEQRKLYDRQREEVLPKKGITLLVIRCDEFDHTSAKRLRRVEKDRGVLIELLQPFLPAIEI
jgi:hypothetical protein